MALPAFQTGHVGLNVTDLSRSTAFYQRVFGFNVLGESADADRRFLFLGSDGTLLLTLWQQSEDGFAADRAGLHHLSFQVPDVPAVQQVEVTLREIGTAIRDDTGTPGEVSTAGQIFFTDPDGIRLEVYAAERPVRPASPPGAEAKPPACGFF